MVAGHWLPGRVAGCRHLSLRASRLFTLPVDLPAAANVQHDNELWPEVVNGRMADGRWRWRRMTTSDMFALAATDAANLGKARGTGHDRAHKSTPDLAGSPVSPTMAATVAANAASVIRRALHPERTTIHHMRVNHRRTHIGVPKELLDGPNVVPVLEQVCGEAVPQRILTLPMNRPPPSFTTVTIHSTANR